MADEDAQSASEQVDIPSLPTQIITPSEPQPDLTVQPQPDEGQYARAADYADRGLPTFAEQEGAVPQVGTLSPEEENFWRANPNGAVIDYSTGNLVGLGDKQPGHLYSDSGPYYVNEGKGPPAIPYDQQQRITTGEGPPSIVQPQQGFQSSLQPRILNESDFTDPLVQNRLNEVRSQMADSSNRLRGLSTVSPRRGQPSPYHIELDRLNHLQAAEQTLVRQLHATAQQRYQVATQNQKLEQATQHANTGANMMGWASSIDSKQYPLGSQQRNELIGQAYAQHPEWLMAQEHNPELAKNMQAVLYGSGRVQKQVQTLQQQFQAKQQSNVASLLAKQGVTPEQFANRTKVEAGTYDANGNFTGQNNGPHTRVTIGNQSFGIPTAQYNAMAQLIPSVQPQQQPQPTATPQQIYQPNPPDPAPVVPQQREINKTYMTPRGELRWTGTGWVNP